MTKKEFIKYLKQKRDIYINELNIDRNDDYDVSAVTVLQDDISLLNQIIENAVTIE